MLVLLKLGGSLITDKDTPRFPRRDVLYRLAAEIAAAKQKDPALRLVLGHGSGSFGHVPASQYGTRSGVSTPQQWLGFAEVWKEARALDEIVIASLHEAGLPVIAFPPSSAVLAQEGRVLSWDLRPLHSALEHGLLPVVYGDVVFDTTFGGTILSTEDLFFFIAHQLHPKRILLAGIEAGVWADFPTCARLLPVITPDSYTSISHSVGGSVSVDVTGGMAQKVASMLALVQEDPALRIQIFSGVQPGALLHALLGENPGTLIKI
jgi:isopentenyl phosphate kinase